MSNHSTRPWWLRKRLLLPFLLLLLFTGACALSLARSAASTIVVYNMTGDPLPPLLVRACGKSRTFTGMLNEDSVCLRLGGTGAPGPIELELATDPPWRWQGSFVTPRDGYRVTLRLWPDGQVEAHTQISIWQRIFMGAPNLNE